MSAAPASYKRFPAARRTACVPVTSARADRAERSVRARAAGQASGDGASPGRRASVPVDLNIKRIKGVVEK
jgi:hypothetical protein